MAEAKNASLAVLGGALAGVRADLPEDGEVTLGSAPDCTVPLEAPSVSPVHARIVLEGGQATVHPTGTERAVHINDTPLGSESATLRNGDILWLGVPGEDDVVMLQCVLPTSVPLPPAPSVQRAVPTPEIETTALWATPPPPDADPVAPPDTALPTGDEPTIALTQEEIQASRKAAVPPPPPPLPVDEEPLVIALDAPTEDEAVVVGEPDLVAAEDIAPVTFGDDADAVIVDEDELFSAAAPTFVGVRPDIEDGAPAAAAEAPVAQPHDDLPEVVVPDTPAPPAAVPAPQPPPPDASAPTVALPRPASPDSSSPATHSGPQASSPLSGLVSPATPPSAGTPAAPRPPDRSTPTARPPAYPDASARGPRRPDRSAPSHPAASQRRRPAPARPAPPPEDDFDDDELDENEAPGRSPVILAVAGFAGVLLVAALGFAVWRFVLAKPAPKPAPLAAATAAPAPPTVAPPVAEPTPETLAPAATASVPEAPEPTPEPTPTQPSPVAAAAQPTPTPPPAAAPTPTPTPPPAPAAPAPAQPSAAELQAQQNAQRLETLLGQANTALASGDHDTAITRFTEALTLDPQSPQARTGRARAIALRDLARRRFVPTRTRVQTEKEQKGGIAGFDMGDADLRKAPDFLGRIEFEMSPATGLQGGAPWTLRIFVVNEGEKPIKIQAVDAVSQVNGTGSNSAVSPRTREVPTQQRLLVGELTGTWQDGTNAWSTQITVTGNKGDSLRATLTWR